MAGRVNHSVILELLPTVHGFHEFFGYLYHLDAIKDRSRRGPSAGMCGFATVNVAKCWWPILDEQPGACVALLSSNIRKPRSYFR
jgi:hypothetical protein